MNKGMWSQIRFAEMFKFSPKSAFEYRKATLGDEIPKEYLTEKKEVKKIEEIKTDLSVDDMKKLLKDNNIKFFAGAKSEALLKKCIENNLI